MGICGNSLERATVTAVMGRLICPQATENRLQQDYLESLIYILVFEDMVDWGLTSTPGNVKGMKKVWEAALAGGTEVNCFLVSKVTALHSVGAKEYMTTTRCGLGRRESWLGAT